MVERELLEAIGGWSGYSLERVQWPDGQSRTLSLYLKPRPGPMRCEQCGQTCSQVHETTVRRVRDLPLFDYRVVLHVPRRRLWCEHCGGPRLEKLDWLGRYQRVTDRLARACHQLLQSSNVQAVGAFFDLGWHTVKSLDKALLRANVAQPDWQRVHYLAMDEFALHKGHRYATVVVDPIGRQVLWVGQGRSRQSARAFFEQLPPGVAQRIRAVAIDMTTAYELEIKAHCPQAEIVYHLFHVVAKYGREVIDRVRVDQANRLRTQPQARRVLKSSRWLLLRKRTSLQPQQAVHLDELLQANKPLMTVYVLRDELKQLWFQRQPAQAMQAWQHWCEQAHQSGIDVLQKFAKRLEGYPQMRDALQSLEVLRVASRCNRGRSRGALIYGPSGSGKSTLARCFEANHPRYDTSDRTVIPVLYVELPSQPTAKVIGEAILTALGDDYAGIGTAEAKLHRAKKLLAACGVELVLIDEIQHISDNLDSRSRDVAADTLKNLMNSTGIPFVFIGLPSGAAYFSNRMQLKRRLNPKVELANFRFVTAAEQDDFGRLLLNFHERLPFTGPSALINNDLTDRLHSASFGLIGSLTLLLEGALRIALRQGTGALTQDHLREAFSSEIFLGCRPSRNPFHVQFNGAPLVGTDEPYFGLRA